MPNTIFFSWQADTPNECGRGFLKEVLEEVCSDLSTETNLSEALRNITVDSDTQGIAGQPPVAATIFEKIDTASVFVADMTFAGRRIDGRPTPNPNVLIEYGWALRSLSYQRVICVMNKAYGKPSRESLPFDLAHLRWPIAYSLKKNASRETREKIKRKLVKILREQVRLSLNTIKPDSAKMRTRVVASISSVVLLASVMAYTLFIKNQKNIPVKEQKEISTDIDFVKEVPWNGFQKPIQLNTPVPGSYTNLMIQVSNSGIEGDSLKILKNGKIIFAPYLAPGGGQSGMRTFTDEDGTAVYSCIPSLRPVTFILNGSFKVIEINNENANVAKIISSILAEGNKYKLKEKRDGAGRLNRDLYPELKRWRNSISKRLPSNLAIYFKTEEKTGEFYNRKVKTLTFDPCVQEDGNLYCTTFKSLEFILNQNLDKKAGIEN